MVDSLSSLMAIFPGEPGLADTKMSVLDLLELRMMEVVTTGAIIHMYAKLQSNRHHQQTNTELFTGRMPFLRPNRQCQSTEGKYKWWTGDNKDKCRRATQLNPHCQHQQSTLYMTHR